MTIADVIGAIEAYAPLHLQESWDNAGVQVGDTGQQATGALLCVDVTEAVVAEAIERGCNLVVSHHPLLFGGLKRIAGRTPVERIVATALKHDVVIYSAHTNLDSTIDGVSWATGRRIGLTRMHALVPQPAAMMKLAVFVPQGSAQAVCEAMWAAGAGRMGNYDRCAYRTEGQGNYRPLEGATPAIGTVGDDHHQAETRIEVVMPQQLSGRVVQAMLKAHPYEEPAFDLLKLENQAKAGLGIVGELPTPMPALEYLQTVKKVLKIGAIPYAGNVARPVRRVALCGGAGAELASAAIAAGADLYLCGDLKYHDYTTHCDRIIMANIGHYESEECTKEIFYDIIQKKFPTFATYYAEQEKNPISYL